MCVSLLERTSLSIYSNAYANVSIGGVQVYSNGRQRLDDLCALPYHTYEDVGIDVSDRCSRFVAGISVWSGKLRLFAFLDTYLRSQRAYPSDCIGTSILALSSQHGI